MTLETYNKNAMEPVADPGCPEVGAPTPKVDVKSYYLANFFPKKLHENEKIWTSGRPWRPLRYANGNIVDKIPKLKCV